MVAVEDATDCQKEMVDAVIRAQYAPPSSRHGDGGHEWGGPPIGGPPTRACEASPARFSWLHSECLSHDLLQRRGVVGEAAQEDAVDSRDELGEQSRSG